MAEPEQRHGRVCDTKSASSKRSPLTFFVLVFALALPFWLLGALVKHVPLPIDLPVSALQFVCPCISALILVSREEQPGGVKKLLKRVFDVKRIKQKLWYMPIMLLNPLMMVLSYGVMLLLGRPLPAPSIPWSLIPLFFVVFFLPAVCEEVDGWDTPLHLARAVERIHHQLDFGIGVGDLACYTELQANPPEWIVDFPLSQTTYNSYHDTHETSSHLSSKRFPQS